MMILYTYINTTQKTAITAVFFTINQHHRELVITNAIDYHTDYPEVGIVELKILGTTRF